jgi:pyruvate dehydrogenase E1 component alpha subunit
MSEAEQSIYRLDDHRAVKSVASFEITYRQFLDPDGHVAEALPEFARDPAALLPLYSSMVLARTFDAKAISLQRTGRLKTDPPCLGEEAVGVGVASTMQPDDAFLPRTAGPALARRESGRDIALLGRR